MTGKGILAHCRAVEQDVTDVENEGPVILMSVVMVYTCTNWADGRMEYQGSTVDHTSLGEGLSIVSLASFYGPDLLKGLKKIGFEPEVEIPGQMENVLHSQSGKIMGPVCRHKTGHTFRNRLEGRTAQHCGCVILEEAVFGD